MTFQDGAGPNRLVHHVARDNMEDQADREPVFVTTRALSSRHVSPDTIDLCSAADDRERYNKGGAKDSRTVAQLPQEK